MSSAATSSRVERWGGGSRMKEAPSIDLSELSTVRHNGSSVSVEPETGTGVWNWWEIANAKIVGDACDRWIKAYYKRTSDRMVVNREYFKARNNRDFTLALQQKRDAERQQSPTP